MIKTAIVILNWNGKRFLEKFLPSVTKYSNNNEVEIIIADNSSSDDSLKFLNKNYPSIRTIILDKNYGFAGGYNMALQQVDAKYYILLNSDVEVTPNWINPIINLMDKNTGIAACMPKILSFANKDQFEYAGAAGGFIDKYGYPFCRGRILSNIEKDNKQYNDTKEIFWATGACMFIRAEKFHELNGFDEDFFAHMEEIDLCWRLKNKGNKIIYSHESVVYHVGGGTLPNNNPFKLYLNYRNNLFLLFKNLPSKKIFSTIFIRLILDGVSALTYLIQLKPKSFWAVLKAHIHFYKELSNLKEKRKGTLIKNHKEIYNNSIVYDFIINKKQKFSDLKF
ncbi:MAG: glycosyltransferase family 2 protein [Bacteroidota bacterium]|nr:glycosyltransferase family 2 protein [Bacteroidota bacterium]